MERSKQKPNMVALPSKEVMIGKLKEAGIMGKDSSKDRLYSMYLEGIANQKLEPSDLLCDWIMLYARAHPNLTNEQRADSNRIFKSIIKVIVSEDIAKVAIGINSFLRNPSAN